MLPLFASLADPADASSSAEFALRSEMLQKTPLRELSLNGCLSLTDEALNTIEDLGSLEYLVIENCPGLTRRRIEKLEHALPNCDIVRD